MIKIVLININKFFKNFSLIFFLFLFGVFISIIALMFTSNVFTSINNYNEKYSPYLRTITVNKIFTIDNINELIFNLQINGLAVNNITVIVQDQPVKASIYYNTYSKLFIQTGSYFNTDDFDNGNLQIVSTPKTSSVANRVGDTLTFFGHEFKIIGFFSDSNLCEVPFKSIPKNAVISSIQIECKRSLSTSDGHMLTKYIKSIFESEIISIPNNTLWTPQVLLQYSFSILISLMALFNVLYLYLYILKIRQKEFLIFRLSGCSKSNGIAIFLLEILTYINIIYIGCALLYHNVLAKLIGNFNSQFTYSMDLNNYLFLYIIFIFVVLALFIPYIIKYCKMSINKLIKENSK